MATRSSIPGLTALRSRLNVVPTTRRVRAPRRTEIESRTEKRWAGTRPTSIRVRRLSSRADWVSA